MDWFSGYDAPDPLHPDLHIHLGNVYLRDFNFNPKLCNDPDPNKGRTCITSFSKWTRRLSGELLASF